jgi:hypothetical protein
LVISALIAPARRCQGAAISARPVISAQGRREGSTPHKAECRPNVRILPKFAPLRTIFLYGFIKKCFCEIRFAIFRPSDGALNVKMKNFRRFGVFYFGAKKKCN